MSFPKAGRRNEGGFILFGVIMLLAVILVMAPAMVEWLQREGRWASKEQKSLSAYNLAEAGVDRGKWMLMSSTATWGAASIGTAIPGYDFLTTYKDVGGGQYRIRFSSGPADREVTIVSEGRDPRSGETRAIRAVFRNSAIPGPLLSRGNITLDGNFYVHWGPVASQGTIFLGTSGTSAQAIANTDLAAGRPYPRKWARLVVQSKSANAAFIRDPDGGITGVNSGGPTGDWQSNYPVVSLPRLDFETLRSSAAASGTLNCYGKFAGYHPEMRDDLAPYKPYRHNNPPSPYHGANESVSWSDRIQPANTQEHRDWTTSNGYVRWRIANSTFTYDPAQVNYPPAAGWNLSPAASAPGKTGFSYTQIPCQADYGCANSDTNCASLPTGPDRVVEGTFFDPRSLTGLVWYWDGTPGVAADQVQIFDHGIRGTVIVRGPALLGGDDLDRLATPLRPGWPAGQIMLPRDAWKEYQRPGFDTVAANEYPGDPAGAPGSPLVNQFYNLSTTVPLRRIDNTFDNFQVGTDLAFSGLLYVGGNLTIDWAPEIYGAVWVDGQILSGTNDLAAVFYDDTLQIPVLDVVLASQSWVEITPTAVAWAP